MPLCQREGRRLLRAIPRGPLRSREETFDRETCRKVPPRGRDKLKEAKTKARPILATLLSQRRVKTGMNGMIAIGGHGTSARSCSYLAAAN